VVCKFCKKSETKLKEVKNRMSGEETETAKVKLYGAEQRFAFVIGQSES
jgi:hypothetical protein